MRYEAEMEIVASELIKNSKVDAGVVAAQPSVDFEGCEDLKARPLMAVVIDDLGHAHYTAKFVAFKRPLTLSFLPYGDALEAQIDKAHANGHEIMLHMPMEPLAKKPKEPMMIMAGMDDAEITERLHEALGRFSHHVGVNNHMGSKITSDRHMMDVVMEVLKDRNLLFLDSMTTSRSTGQASADEAGVQSLARDVFLDDQYDERSPFERLMQTHAKARKNGYAIAIGHPVRRTYDDMLRFMDVLARDKTVDLVPLAVILRKKNCLAREWAAASVSKDQGVHYAANDGDLARLEQMVRSVDEDIAAIRRSLSQASLRQVP